MNRKEKIFDFIVKYKVDCDKAFKTDVLNKLKNDDVRKLIRLARKEIGYSPKTVNADIYKVLIRVYNAQ